MRIGITVEVEAWPTTGWKSFFISHVSISGPRVSARRPESLPKLSLMARVAWSFCSAGSVPDRPDRRR
jgi:hypothetical protein